MDSLLRTSAATIGPLKLSSANGYFGATKKDATFRVWSPKPSTFGPPTRRGGGVVSAKDRKTKEDTHAFIPKPDEATGPFPEALLLKQKKLQEDGRLVPEFADAEEEKLYEVLNLELQSQLNVERMRHYEVVYLIHETHADEVGSVNERVQDFLREKKGKIWRLNDWGMRRLAYKIQKAKNAHYMLMNFELEAKWINDFKSLLDKDERVIRHLVIKRDEAITEDCPPPPEYHTLRAGFEDDDDLEYDDEAYDEDDDAEDEIDYDEEEEDSFILVYSDDDNNNGNRFKAMKPPVNSSREKVGR